MGTEYKQSKPSQCKRIIQYIADFGSITQIDALRDLGCMRLASRISEIKEKGLADITKVMEEGKNRYGEKIRYARYSFTPKEEA